MTRPNLAALRFAAAISRRATLAAGRWPRARATSAGPRRHASPSCRPGPSGNATGDQFNKLARTSAAQTGIKIDIEEANNDDVAPVFEASALADEQSATSSSST